MTELSGALDAPDSQRLTERVQYALDEATSQGASSACATARASSGLSVSVRLGELETIEHHRSKQVSVTVYFGHRTGSASSSDTCAAAIESTVAAACRIARHTREDVFAGLADAHRMADRIAELDLYHPWPLSAENAHQIALEVEDTARAHDPRITNSDGATVSTYQGSRVYGNSHGFRGELRGTRHGMRCTPIADQDGHMQRALWHTVSRSPAALESAAAVGSKAGRRTVNKLGARRITTRTVPVVFAAEQATKLFGNFISAIRGANLYRKASFLRDHLGKQVFAGHIGIREEPHLKGALGSSPFDREGVATEPRDIVVDGVLQSYVLDSYSGRRLNMPTTGNAGGVRNLVVKPGRLSFEELLQAMDTGLLITDLMGMGVNIVTGDYSRGVAGFWVENGEVQYPVEEITAAGNLRDMFVGLQAVSDDVDHRSNIRTGSVLIDRMTIAGG